MALLSPSFPTATPSYSAATAAALDGGENAKATRNKKRKLVIQDLKALALYVESNCNDDPAILTVRTPVKTAGQPVPALAIKSPDYGANSGQITCTLKKVPGAKVYFLRYAVMIPGSWTTLAVLKTSTSRPRFRD